MDKFDQQKEFEIEFRRRFGTEVFLPGGKVEHNLNSYKNEMLLFCTNWIADHSTTRIVEKSRRTLYRMKEKIIIHQMQPAAKMAMPLSFTNDTFVEYLKALQLFAVQHEDAATAKEINRRLNQFVNEVIPISEPLPDTDTDI